MGLSLASAFLPPPDKPLRPDRPEAPPDVCQQGILHLAKALQEVPVGTVRPQVLGLHVALHQVSHVGLAAECTKELPAQGLGDFRQGHLVGVVTCMEEAVYCTYQVTIYVLITGLRKTLNAFEESQERDEEGVVFFRGSFAYYCFWVGPATESHCSRPRPKKCPGLGGFVALKALQGRQAHRKATQQGFQVEQVGLELGIFRAALSQLSEPFEDVFLKAPGPGPPKAAVQVLQRDPAIPGAAPDAAVLGKGLNFQHLHGLTFRQFLQEGRRAQLLGGADHHLRQGDHDIVANREVLSLKDLSSQKCFQLLPQLRAAGKETGHVLTLLGRAEADSARRCDGGGPQRPSQQGDASCCVWAKESKEVKEEQAWQAWQAQAAQGEGSGREAASKASRAPPPPEKAFAPNFFEPTKKGRRTPPWENRM